MRAIHRSAIILVLSIAMFAGCGPKEVKNAQLWPDGAWVLYEQTREDTDGSQVKGTLKVSSIGAEMVDGKPYYWIEIREDNQTGVKITKFLAAENAAYDPMTSFVFWDDIKRIIIQENNKTPEEVPAQHLKRYTPVYIESSKSKRFGNIKDTDQPQISEIPETSFQAGDKQITAKGMKITRRYTSSVNLGFLNLEDTTESSTEYFRSPDVPFGGIVKVTHSSQTSSINKLKPDQEAKPPQVFNNTLVLTQFGMSGASSQIIGEPVEMKVLPFPFLKGGQGNPQGSSMPATQKATQPTGP